MYPYLSEVLENKTVNEVKKGRYICMENVGRVSKKTQEVRKENKPNTLVSLASLLKEELDKELQKGIDSLKNDKTYSIDEVDAFFMKKYGI